MQLEGFAYRLVPIRTPNQDNSIGRVNPDILYQNIIQEFTFGDIEKDNTHVDEYQRRQLNICDVRNVFARLALEYIRESNYDKAIEVLDRSLEMMPDHKVPYDQRMLSYIKAYYLCGAKEKARAVSKQLGERYQAEGLYYQDLKEPFFSYTDQDRKLASYILTMIQDLDKTYQ
jgi:tetratricopeptide (TPR) repeat protein